MRTGGFLYGEKLDRKPKVKSKERVVGYPGNHKTNQ